MLTLRRNVLRCAFLLLVITSLPHWTAWATDPKAVLRGPATVVAGDPITLEFVTCQGDGPVWLKASDPALKLSILYERQDTGGSINSVPVAGRVTIDEPGIYQFTLVTQGVPKGLRAPDISLSSVNVTVTPKGQPGPTPGPGPSPGPTPTPTPSNLPMFAIAVYSGDTTNQAERDFLKVRRESTMVGMELKKLNAEWRVFDVGNTKIDMANLRQQVTEAKTPCLIVYDAKSILFSGTAPNSPEAVIAVIKKIRGIK